MANYSLNEVNTMLTLGECNKSYRRTFRHYAELYFNRHYPSGR